MAFMTSPEEKEIQNDEQKHKKDRRRCCVCCGGCCFCCTEFLSGLILLLIVAGLVLCVRIFLEFPVILNGFGRTSSTFNLSSQATSVMPQSSSITPSGITGSASSYRQCVGNTDPTRCNNTYRVYTGSFQLVNESYQSQYNDTSTVGFRVEAKRIEAMLCKLFNRSLITAYNNASTFELSPGPFTVRVQLLFCNASAKENGINVDTVSKVLKSFNATLDGTNITLDTASVVVGGDAPCPSSVGLGHMWPWQATIQERQTPICMGSLLATFWVLAPATCVSKSDRSLLGVTLGGTSPVTTMWKVTNVILHPNYTPSPLTNDIALLLLSAPVLFSTTILPICLPPTTLDPAVGTLCNMTNGNISTALSTDGLMNVAGTVTTGLSCLATSQNGVTYIRPTFSTTSLVQVDVGSSLVCMSSQNAVYLQGIASFQQKSTDVNSPCINYTSIGLVKEWIKSYIAEV